MAARAALAAFAVLATGSSARADYWLIGENEARETMHRVDLMVDGEAALLRVRRDVVNLTDKTQELALVVALPSGAAVTGLRVGDGVRWRSATPTDAASAERDYLDGVGRGPGPAAVLDASGPDELQLRLSPVPPRRRVAVEYTLLVPVRYFAGARLLTYPKLVGDQAGLVAPALRVQGSAALRITVDGRPVRPGQRVALREPALDPEVLERTGGSPERARLGSAARLRSSAVLAARGYRDTPQEPDPSSSEWATNTDEEPFDGEGPLAVIALATSSQGQPTLRLGSVELGAERALTRLEIDVPYPLSPLPARSSVVFALDASRSMGRDGLAAQLAAVSAFAAHLPDGAFEVVVYHRRARRAFGRFVPAPELPDLLRAIERSAEQALGNGSALEEGARLAAEALRGRQGPLRLVLFTDDQLASRFAVTEAASALAQAPPGTLAHVVVLETTRESALSPLGGHRLAPLATAHGGLAVQLGLTGLPEPELPRLMLGLVRPVSVEGVVVRGACLRRRPAYEPGAAPANPRGEAAEADETAAADAATDDDDAAVDDELELARGLTLPASLLEGAGLRVEGLTDGRCEKLEVTGAMWGRPVRWEVSRSQTFSRRAATWAVVDHAATLESALAAAEPALRRLAVTDSSSLVLAARGGPRTQLGMISSTCGCASIRESARVTVSVPKVTPPTLESLLAPAVQRCALAHRPPAGWAVELEVETTRDEIVDVQVAKGDALSMAGCLEEAAWDLRLPDSFREPRARSRARLR